MTFSHERVLQICSAEGWRCIYAMEPNDNQDPREMEFEDLTWIEPVACFALVEHWVSETMHERRPPEDQSDVTRSLDPVTSQGSWIDVEDSDYLVAVIGPGVLSTSFKDQVIETILRKRTQRETLGR